MRNSMEKNALNLRWTKENSWSSKIFSEAAAEQIRRGEGAR